MISRAVVCPGAPLLIPGLAEQLRAQCPEMVDAVDRAVGPLRQVDRILLLSSGPRTRDGGRIAPQRSVVHPPGTAVSSTLITGTSGPPHFAGRLAGPPVIRDSGPAPGVGVVVGASLLARAGVDAPTTAIEVADPTIDVGDRTIDMADRTDEVAALLDGARSSADRVGVLVLAEGSASRGPSSPGGGSPDADVLDEALAVALRTGNPAAVRRAAELDAAAAERLLFTAGPALRALADLAASPPGRAELLLSAAPFGVGYLVAAWYWDDRG